MITRRDFLQIIMTAGISCTCWPAAASEISNNNKRLLILVELAGGNDGLNTIIPYTDQNYYDLRPTLAIKRDTVLQLDESLGLHPSLQPLIPGWQANELAIALGVGYPQPNRSHFRSIEIWDTGSHANQYLESGWLEQVLTRTNNRHMALDGLVIGNGIGPLQSNKLRTLVTRNPDHLLRQSRRMSLVRNSGTKNPALAHLLAVHNELTRGSQRLRDQVESSTATSITYPKSRIGKALSFTGQLIRSGAPARVIKISHGSFDTHANQHGKHARLLMQLAESLSSFRNDMRLANKWDDILLMTYSEFGRRANENGSRGTDHGTAAPHLIMGGRVKGGLYGRQPGLVNLQNGDLKHTLDFRQTYATASTWLGAATRFNRKKYPAINCIR